MPQSSLPGAIMRALVPETLLTVGAMAVLLASVWTPQRQQPQQAEGADRTSGLSRLAMVLCLLVGITVVIAWGDHTVGSPDQRIAGDGFRWVMDLLILAGTALALGLLDTDARQHHAYSPEVPALMLLAAVGMMILAAARDLMLVFLGIELMSLAVYVLAGVHRRRAQSAEAALKYFLLGAFATGFLLYGMALVFGATGSTRYVDIAVWVRDHAGLTPMFRIGVALLLIGFGFKIAAAPFHVWTPDVYEGAPAPITAFMASVVKAAAFAALLRLTTEVLASAVIHWHATIWWMAVATILAGNIVALAQRHVVRMLGYSSIAHAGYLLAAVLANSSAGVGALVFYLASYTLATMGIFAVVIAARREAHDALTLDDLAGLWFVRPGLATGMAVCVLAFLGMPLAGGMGFFAKWYLLQAAWQASAPQTVLAVVMVLGSIISAGYYLALVSSMFMRPRAETAPAPHEGPRILLAITVAVLLLLGVYPVPMAQLAQHARIGNEAAPAPSAAPSARPATLSTASVSTFSH